MSLCDWDALALSGAIAARVVSPVEVMAAVLGRIAAINPRINAIVGLGDPDDLMAQARAAEAAPRRGWLHGVPLAVKDLVAVAGLAHTDGSPIHRHRVAVADDPLAARLRRAGAIPIAKTNVPEFGLGSHSYNPVWGVTRNPYDLGRSAGGSSGGAAAALAARLVAVADGSDMMGSLRNPAAFCNVYGLRPSHGLVPGEAAADPLSTLGPMARTVADLAAMLGTMAGAALAGPLDAPVAGRRIGWVGDWAGHYPMEPGILDLGLAVAAVFAALGLMVEPLDPGFDPARLWDAWGSLRSHAIAANLGDLWRDPAIRPLLKPEAVWEIERGLALTPAAVARARGERGEWVRHAADLFGRFDALMLPSAQVWPFAADLTWPRAIAGRTMDTYHRWMAVVVPASLAGLPALAIPAGFGAAGLPMGMQLVGPRGGDLGLLQIAQAYHRATEWPQRHPPGVA